MTDLRFHKKQIGEGAIRQHSNRKTRLNEHHRAREEPKEISIESECEFEAPAALPGQPRVLRSKHVRYEASHVLLTVRR